MKQQIATERVGNDLGIFAPKVFLYVVGNRGDLVIEIQPLEVTHCVSTYNFVALLKRLKKI